MRKYFRTTILILLFCSFFTITYASGFYREGDQGKEVAEIQQRLSELGFYNGNIDGDFGGKTVIAVEKFQQAIGLDIDGIIGIQTYKALMKRDLPASRAAVAAKIRRIIHESMNYLGVPYVFGGTSVQGFDCSGFTRFIFAGSGVNLPRTADNQYEVGYPITYNRLQPGDLVFFETYEPGPSHSGIYLGNGKFISATSSRGIAVDRIDSSYWSQRYIGARRVL